MASLNFLPCGTATRGNSGLEGCKLDLKALQWIISLPAGVVITPSILSTLGTTNAGIKALIQAESPNGRAQIWGKFMVNADNSTDPDVYSFEDKSTEEIGLGTYSWRFRHRNGMCYHKQLRRQNGDEANRNYIFIDKMGVMAVGRLDSNGNVPGIQLSKWYARPWKTGTETESAQLLLDVEITDIEQFNLDGNYVNAGVGIGDRLARLAVTDAVATLGGTPAAGIYPILLTTGCSAKSIASFDTAGALASNTIFKAVNQLGAAIPVTAVAIAGTGNAAYYAVTLDTTSANYTAATTITFSFVSVAATATAFKPLEMYGADASGNITINFTTPKV